MAITAGTHLGPYEILSPLGAGGMGEVYRARDTRLEREAAIKVLPANSARDPARLRRFEKEARSASSLNHPNIVTVHDVGDAEGIAFMAMELVVGRTLRDLIREGPLPTKRLLSIASQLADGLSRAHDAGLIHRDLKPENVMVRPDGIVKILDFGLAKLTETEPIVDDGKPAAETVTRPTDEGKVMGTAAYMSPEQARGNSLDFRSDQFAIGAIAYEMATGRRAFQRASPPETLAAIIREEPNH
jgi:serine/threonine protein kinase